MMREKLADQIAQRIIEHIRDAGLREGEHLSTKKLAALLQVSRTPISTALRELSAASIVYSEPRRGYFVARSIGEDVVPRQAPRSEVDEEDKLYFRIAEDRLAGHLPDRVSENELMRRYRTPRGRLQLLLTQIAEEGWIERLPGHGWRFGSSFSTVDAYRAAYLFRAALESQAMVLPDYRIDREELDLLRAQQRRLLDGAMFTLPRDQLYALNTHFHETIVGWGNNGFFLDSLRRINRLRRLMEYHLTTDRSRLKQQTEEHMKILDLLEQGDRETVSTYLKEHISGALSRKREGLDSIGES
jgi:DNA-binding GntR family transcriptional regulator